MASSHPGWREVNFPAATVAIPMAILIVVVVQLMVTSVNCSLCGHPRAEHYSWLLVPCRCRMCHR